MHAKKPWIAALALAAWPVTIQAQVKETRRLDQARELLRELAGGAEAIPSDLMQKAECVAVIPGVKKVAIGLGARTGRGAMLCRSDRGRGDWGPPFMIRLRGGSFGLQIGGQAVDLLLLVMNPRGIEALLESQLTLGADASVAAGPVGRSAEAGTDLRLRAEILSYSRSRGLFAGVALEGAALKPDDDANWALYGERVDARALLLSPGQRVPAAALSLVATLRELAPPRGE